MQKQRINLSIAALFALTVLFIPVGDAFAQTQVPIFGEDPVASIRVGSEVVIAPLVLMAELEDYYGEPAMISTLNGAIATLNPAFTGDTVRFEGGWPEGEAVESLEALGYAVSTSVTPNLESAGVASVLSD